MMGTRHSIFTADTRVRVALAAGGLFSLAAPALAHEAGGTLGGFKSGFTHPLFGWDHLLAMLAVGLWGAQIGGASVWKLPVTFPLIMAVGGFAGAAGMPFPFVEPAIALSVVVLGLAIAFVAKPPEWGALAVISFFALAHGHAHGTELPQAADAVSYGIGFVLATGLIHLAGIGFGLLAKKPKHGARMLQASGAAMSLFGLILLFG